MNKSEKPPEETTEPTQISETPKQDKLKNTIVEPPISKPEYNDDEEEEFQPSKNQKEPMTIGEYNSWSFYFKNKVHKNDSPKISREEVKEKIQAYSKEFEEQLLKNEGLSERNLEIQNNMKKDKEALIQRSKQMEMKQDRVSLYKMEENQLQDYESQHEADSLKNYYDPNRTDSLKFGDWSNIMHMSKTEEKAPKFYKDLHLSEELTKFNVGNKLGAMIVSSINKRRKFEKAMGKGIGAYIYESTKRGRLGIDLYLIAFAVFGCMAIPVYHYTRERPFKKLADKNRPIIDDVMEKGENSQYDIDDISLHENYNTLYKKEIEEFKLKKFKIKREIKKLEKELYDEQD